MMNEEYDVELRDKLDDLDIEAKYNPTSQQYYLTTESLNKIMQLFDTYTAQQVAKAEREAKVSVYKRAFGLVNDVRYGKRSLDAVFHQLIEECSEIEAELDIARLDAKSQTNGDLVGEKQ